MNSARAGPRAGQTGRYENGTSYMDQRSRKSNGLDGCCKSLSVPELPIGPPNASPDELTPSVVLGNMVGRSPEMQEVFSMIRKLAPSSAPVLIGGQSGTGKELVAREIHNCSSRRNGPFVAINAAALPESLIESELFGYEKGAFTGATERHAGCFEQAHGGTLFLDELGEMPRSAQPILLRVLETLRVRRLGGRNELSVDVRLLAATSQPAETHLRDDIFYRLSVFQILLPPLREREEDIPLLAQVMIRTLNQKNGTLVTGIDSEVLDVFKAYEWPGNARELRNVIERATIVAGTGTLHLEHLPAAVLGQTFAAHPKDKISMALLPGERLAKVEEAYIALTLRHVGNNVAEAAALLGISPRTVRNRIAVFQKTRRPQRSADDQLRLTEIGATGGQSMAAAKGAAA
jgi:DNA-binding NtrC family response regulator